MQVVHPLDAVVLKVQVSDEAVTSEVGDCGQRVVVQVEHAKVAAHG